ncbi:MAG TPA: hypothetical protein VN048_07210 [Verrucomicrobiae bacterium]|jgi:hypothetical protein|nr:hypothetical protein [Verrucomicrobiae bacterium]
MDDEENSQEKIDLPEKTASRETSQIPPTEAERTEQPDQSQPELEEDTLEKTPTGFWAKHPVLLRFLKTLGEVFGIAVSLIWAVALWDSYRPKITVTPGPNFDPKDPFSTVFIIENQGALPIRNVSFDSTWTYADDENQTRNVQIGLMKIPELKPLEQHAMLNLSPPKNTDTNKPANGDEQLHAIEVTPMPIAHHSLMLWYDVTYYPQFFSKKTTTLYFYGTWDCQTNFQWLPTGSGDFRFQGVDVDLLKRALELQKSIEKNRDAMLAEKAKAGTNSSPKTIPASPINAAGHAHNP